LQLQARWADASHQDAEHHPHGFGRRVIAGQRRAAELTLRQLAEQAGVSNPYLSQIERRLRRPSAEVLQRLAKALRLSGESPKKPCQKAFGQGQ
jgi:transcriptional regulator with XRE-family HTH domain